MKRFIVNARLDRGTRSPQWNTAHVQPDDETAKDYL